MSLPDVSFASTDLARNISDLLEKARKTPVTITQYRKPKFVVMSVDEYERLNNMSNPRKAFFVRDMPDEMANELLSAIDNHLDGNPDGL